MDATFINPFLSAMSNVLTTMAMLEINPGTLSLKSDDIPKGDVTGVISMKSPKTEGTLAISFTAPVIIDITRRMLGEEVSSINETVTDLVGEITNMVTGSAKSLLDENGHSFDMATPVVFIGKEKKISHKKNSHVIVLPFETEAGEFFVELCFSKPA